ncbi:PREDICTED: apolipoprotein L2-like [Dipodomys ordii]|uniref:Apolipoprotein L2-like n=1 Tax=Dipodomys ordii TaxID=10020 RepID=A0A1S3FW63_DIPOR|nr:PREDICTED: apolipoprotein L2-like [Dipodomys ordii]
MSARSLFIDTAKKLVTSPDARQFIGNVSDFLVDQLGPEYASLLVTEDQIWEVFVAAVGLSRSLAQRPVISGDSPWGTENKDFFKFVIDNLQDPANWDYLQLLLTEDDAWEEFMTGAVLSRYEGVALRKALEQLAADAAMEDTDRLCTELQDRKSFLDTFPQVKMELEEQIRKLRELADKADKVQRDCAISRVVASSTSAASGVLRILSLAVAPVTLGGLETLLVSGLGLEAVSTLTSAASSLVGGVRKWSVEAEATHLLSTSMDKGKTVKEVLTETTPKVAALGKKYFQDLPHLQKNIEAIRLAKANPRLAASARTLMTAGTISARSTKQVQKVFGGTILAMTKGARMMGAATAGVFLLMDVVNLVKESKRLFQGPKTESAEKLRQEALELEKKLEELMQIHERVLSDVSWMPSLERQRESSMEKFTCIQQLVAYDEFID